MFFLRKIIIAFLIFVAGGQLTTAQTITQFPKIIPTYSKYLKADNFPSLCIDRVFEDPLGRLWFSPCGLYKYRGIYFLYQFDGYSYHVINEGMDEIAQANNVNFFDITKKGLLLGYGNFEGKRKLFSYDTFSNKFKFLALDEILETATLIGVQKTPQDELLVITNKNNQFQLYTIIDTTVQLSASISIDTTSLKTISKEDDILGLLYSDKEDVWITSQRINLIHWDLKKQKFNLFKTQDIIQRQFGEIKIPINKLRSNTIFSKSPEASYFAVSKKSCTELYQINENSDFFEKIKWVPETWRSYLIKTDNQGNILFLFEDENKANHAVLKDKNGQLFDYSAMLSFSGSIRDVYGNDFTKQLFFCTSNGLYNSVAKKKGGIINDFEGYSIRHLLELNKGQYLVKAEKKEWQLLDLNKGTVSSTSEQFLFGDIKFDENIIALFKGEEGSILLELEHQIIKHDVKSGSNSTIFTPMEDKIDIEAIDENGVLYSSLGKCFYWYDFKTKKVEPILDENGKAYCVLKNLEHIYDVGDGTIIMTTLKEIFKIDKKTRRIIELDLPKQFKEYRFSNCHIDKNGKLWFGSFNKGILVYDPVTNEETIIDQRNSLVNNTVTCIMEDDEGTKWVGTFNGISLLSPAGEVIANISEKDGLINNENNRFAFLKTSDNKLLFGTIDGLSIIDPVLLKSRLFDKNKSKVILTELSYFNSQTDKDTFHLTNLHNIPKISLPATQRYLRLNFALTNYEDPQKNEFAYKLEGIDKNWTFIGTQRRLSLSNLPAGKYKILIKGRDANGVWSIDLLTIPVKVNEFFYKKAWFYFFLAMPFLVIAWFWIKRLTYEKIRLEKEVDRRTKQINKDKEFIEQQARELRKLDELKSRFFTNLSHELRTPITLITAPVQQLIKTHGQKFGKGVGNTLSLILKNGQNLLQLVEELLDLSRLEADKINLNETPTELKAFCRQLFGVFESRATMKGIDYTFECDLDEKQLFWIDKKRFEKIINNLLSNAMKFTSNGGLIQLSVKQEGENLSIRVKDTGRGIPEEDKPHVFELYFQTKNETISTEGGTGIGLALSKELAKLMKGDLRVQSTLGVGSVFTLEFSARLAGQVQSPVESESFETYLKEEPVFSVNISAGSEAKASLMIVEDNPDMQQMIHFLLADNYHCQLMNNGREAWDKLNDKNTRINDFDLIISDVMMPKMDGYELLKRIKQHPEWHKKPVVMLTARAEEEDKLKALRLGVDDYVLKPFSPDELIARIANLINNSRKRQTFLEKNQDILTPEFTKTDSADQVWLKELEELAITIMDKKMSISATYLASEMTLSERQLLRRLKALTGLTIKQYIQEIRLQKARYLLENKTYNTLTEVAYASGFNTPGYFTKVFEKHFGKKPGEYF